MTDTHAHAPDGRSEKENSKNWGCGGQKGFQNAAQCLFFPVEKLGGREELLEALLGDIEERGVASGVGDRMLEFPLPMCGWGGCLVQSCSANNLFCELDSISLPMKWGRD